MIPILSLSKGTLYGDKNLSYEYTLIRVGHNFKFGFLTFMIYRAGRSNLSITKKLANKDCIRVCKFSALLKALSVMT